MRRILEEEAENRMIRVHTYALARIPLLEILLLLLYRWDFVQRCDLFTLIFSMNFRSGGFS